MGAFNTNFAGFSTTTSKVLLGLVLASVLLFVSLVLFGGCTYSGPSPLSKFERAVCTRNLILPHSVLVN